MLGHHRMQKLSAQHVQAFYTKKLNEGLAATTVGVFHIVLHKAFDTAVKWGLVPRNVCDLVSPPRAKKFEMKPLTLEQTQQLLTAARGHPQEALFILALATGMRRGELLALKWQDINFTKGVLQVRRESRTGVARPQYHQHHAGCVFTRSPLHAARCDRPTECDAVKVPGRWVSGCSRVSKHSSSCQCSCQTRVPSQRKTPQAASSLA